MAIMATRCTLVINLGRGHFKHGGGNSASFWVRGGTAAVAKPSRSVSKQSAIIALKAGPKHTDRCGWASPQPRSGSLESVWGEEFTPCHYTALGISFIRQCAKTH